MQWTNTIYRHIHCFKIRSMWHERSDSPLRIHAQSLIFFFESIDYFFFSQVLKLTFLRVLLTLHSLILIPVSLDKHLAATVADPASRLVSTILRSPWPVQILGRPPIGVVTSLQCFVRNRNIVGTIDLLATHTSAATRVDELSRKGETILFEIFRATDFITSNILSSIFTGQLTLINHVYYCVVTFNVNKESLFTFILLVYVSLVFTVQNWSCVFLLPQPRTNVYRISKK